jgi:hypothetical protein
VFVFVFVSKLKLKNDQFFSSVPKPETNGERKEEGRRKKERKKGREWTGEEGRRREKRVEDRIREERVEWMEQSAVFLQVVT